MDNLLSGTLKNGRQCVSSISCVGCDDPPSTAGGKAVNTTLSYRGEDHNFRENNDNTLS